MFFKEYLQQKAFTNTTITSYCKKINEFTNFLELLNTTIKELTYNDLLLFIKYLRSKTNTETNINHKLRIIKHYLDYKLKINEIDENPALNLRLRETNKYKLYNILKLEELKELFINFPTKNQTNKIISGLIIFQALQSSELQRLKKQDFDLDKAKIFILGSRRKNSRYLELKSFQIINLYEYLKNKKKSESIFEIKYFHNRLKNIKNQLISQNEKLTNLNQIRTSTITNWLKTNNLRQTQYMAGHKFVSSTEHYKQNNLENLQKEIKKYHPL